MRKDEDAHDWLPRNSRLGSMSLVKKVRCSVNSKEKQR